MCWYAHQAPAIQVATRQPAENGPMRDLGRLGGGLIGISVRPDWSNIECASPAHSDGNACSIQQYFVQRLNFAFRSGILTRATDTLKC